MLPVSAVYRSVLSPQFHTVGILAGVVLCHGGTDLGIAGCVTASILGSLSTGCQ